MTVFSLNISAKNQLNNRVPTHKLTCEQLISYLENPDAAVRCDAAEILGCQREVKAVSAMRSLLKDPDKSVRIQAALSLIRMGEDHMLQDLMKSLFHPDRRVVMGAALALGRLEDDRASPSLLNAFITDDPEIGALVAWALGQCKNACALPLLILAIQHHFVPANACEALGKIGDVRALNILLEALEFKYEDVRAYAARALSLLNFEKNSDQKKTVVSALRTLLSDRSRKVRMCVAVSLYQLSHEAY
jgi:HEAT repeat protein